MCNLMKKAYYIFIHIYILKFIFLFTSEPAIKLGYNEKKKKYVISFTIRIRK